MIRRNPLIVFAGETPQTYHTSHQNNQKTGETATVIAESPLQIHEHGRVDISLELHRRDHSVRGCLLFNQL